MDGRFMRRLAFSPLNAMLVLMLVAVVPQQAFGPPPTQRQAPAAPLLPSTRHRFRSTSSRCRTGSRSRCGRRRRCCTTRPTSTSIATAASGWPKAFAIARIMPASPKAIASSCCRTPTATARPTATHTFVQEPALIAPLGVAVIDNKVVVSQPPDLIVYTDVDRNLRFDPAVDKREVLLTGFQGINHDHSLHSVTVGPDGKWIFNSGNTGGDVHRQVGEDVPHLRVVSSRPGRPVQVPERPGGLRRASRATTGMCTSADSRCG